MSIIIDKGTYKTQTADSGKVLVNGDTKVKSIDLPLDAEHWAEEYDIMEWHEPEWSMRMFVDNEKVKAISSEFPQLLLGLNVEPRNPRYNYTDGMMIYLRTLNPDEMAVLARFEITEKSIEHKPE